MRHVFARADREVAEADAPTGSIAVLAGPLVGLQVLTWGCCRTPTRSCLDQVPVGAPARGLEAAHLSPLVHRQGWHYSVTM